MKFTALLIAPLVASFLSAGVPPSETGSATNVRLDGIIDAEEWAGATRHDLVDGGELLMKQEDDALHLALRGGEFGWSHVYISRGDSVFVLHASAALGTAVYDRNATGTWELSAPFEWAVRDTTFSAEAEASRARFLAKHEWVANTNGMGTKRVIEFRIEASVFDAEEPRLAVLFASDPEQPRYWPHSLDDATLDARLISGQAPERLDFDPSTWAVPR